MHRQTNPQGGLTVALQTPNLICDDYLTKAYVLVVLEKALKDREQCLKSYGTIGTKLLQEFVDTNNPKGAVRVE